jgi:hypothetical protein
MEENPEFILTQEQESSIVAFWNSRANSPPSLKEIVDHLFPNENLDGRSKEARAIKKSLAKRNIKAKTTSVYEKTTPELTKEQKTYVENHAKTTGPLQIAKDLFNNQALINLDSEVRAVNEYLKTLEPGTVLSKEVQDIPDGDYEPPDTLDKALRKINKYTNNSHDKSKLSPQEKKGVFKLIDYMHTFRFIKQMNTYDSESDRQSFEDAFVRYTYNKPELTQEEIDQYIILANEVVLSFKAQRRSEKLQGMLETITDNNEPESTKFAMSLVESIGKAQSEYNLSIQRHQKLLSDLTEKRSEKLSKEIKNNSSVLNILEAWKHEESRKQWLKIAEIEQRAVSEEVERLATMDELKAKLFGISPEELRNG